MTDRMNPDRKYLKTNSVSRYILCKEICSHTYSWKFDEFIICTEKIKLNLLIWTVSSFLIYEQKYSILEMRSKGELYVETIYIKT